MLLLWCLCFLASDHVAHEPFIVAHIALQLTGQFGIRVEDDQNIKALRLVIDRICQATLAMVDANRQREHILPSEKAFAYKMRDDALKHLRAGQVVPPVGRTTEQIGRENDESDRNVRRMIRLTKLIPPLLDMVDRGKLGTTTAVELSYLSKKEQEAVQTAIEAEQSIPSQTQAKMLRRLHDEDEFTEDTPLQVLSGNKGKAAEKLSIPMETLLRFFRRDETPTQMIEAIVKALELLELKKKRERQMAR